VELKNEAKSHALNHVNVVTLYAMIFEPKHYGIVLEFVPHGCLEGFIGQYKVPCDLTKCVVFMCNSSSCEHMAGPHMMCCEWLIARAI